MQLWSGLFGSMHPGVLLLTLASWPDGKIQRDFSSSLCLSGVPQTPYHRLLKCLPENFQASRDESASACFLPRPPSLLGHSVLVKVVPAQIQGGEETGPASQ